MEEVLGIFGEVDHSDLLHKAQRIKGNQAGTLHVWFPCSISVRGGGCQWRGSDARTRSVGGTSLILRKCRRAGRCWKSSAGPAERCLYSSDAPYGEPYLYRQLIEFVSPDKRTAEMALGEHIPVTGITLRIKRKRAHRPVFQFWRSASSQAGRAA